MTFASASSNFMYTYCGANACLAYCLNSVLNGEEKALDFENRWIVCSSNLNNIELRWQVPLLVHTTPAHLIIVRSSDPDPGFQIMTEVTSHIHSLLIIWTPRGAGCLTIFILLTANKTAGKLNALKFNIKFVNRETFDCKERDLVRH